MTVPPGRPLGGMGISVPLPSPLAPVRGLGGVGEVGVGMGFSERAAAAPEVAGEGDALSGLALGVLLLSSLSAE